ATSRIARAGSALVISSMIGALAHSRAGAQEQGVRGISVQPAEIVLCGDRATQRVLVTGEHGSSVESDLTSLARFEMDDALVAAVRERGLVSPRGTGQTMLRVRYGEHARRVRVRVVGFGQKAPVDFRTEVVAALGRGGCNQGACHGSPQGKGGFRLSLRGFDPELDYLSLTRESFGRRTDVFAPSESLVLQKALLRTPHQGGRRFQADAPAYRAFRDWIAEGCRLAPSAPGLKDIQVSPARRYLHSTSPKQQLMVLGRFDDHSVRDVTDLAVFSSSNEADATVTTGGLVEFRRTAETVILARYLERIVTAPLAYVRTDPNFVAAASAAGGEIDKHVFEKHRRLQLRATGGADDSVFLRRA